MIIDGHVHIHPKPDGFGSKYDASEETLISSLRKGSIDKAVILAIAPEISNELIADSCEKYPDELIGFASVEPLSGNHAITQLEIAVEQLGLKGLKLHPRRQSFGINNANEILPLIKKASELRIPVLIDAFPYGQGMFKRQEIELISILAESVPKAQFIVAHAGGHRLFDAFMVAKSNYNIFLDISFTLHYYKGTSIEADLKFVICKIGAERVIYGSDHPTVPLLTAFEETMSFLDQCGLSDKEIDCILGKNIISLIE